MLEDIALRQVLCRLRCLTTPFGRKSRVLQTSGGPHIVGKKVAWTTLILIGSLRQLAFKLPHPGIQTDVEIPNFFLFSQWCFVVNLNFSILALIWILGMLLMKSNEVKWQFWVKPAHWKEDTVENIVSSLCFSSVFSSLRLRFCALVVLKNVIPTNLACYICAGKNEQQIVFNNNDENHRCCWIISQKQNVKNGETHVLFEDVLIYLPETGAQTLDILTKKTGSVKKISAAYITDISSCARSATRKGRWCGYIVILLKGLSRFGNDNVSGLASGKCGGQTWTFISRHLEVRGVWKGRKFSEQFHGAWSCLFACACFGDVTLVQKNVRFGVVV